MRLSLGIAGFVMAFCFPLRPVSGALADNLLADPSFEQTKEKDQFGLVFARWGGWKYEGDCEFRVGQIGHSGKHSCLLSGGIGAKIRIAQNVELEPGVTASPPTCAGSTSRPEPTTRRPSSCSTESISN